MKSTFYVVISTLLLYSCNTDQPLDGYGEKNASSIYDGPATGLVKKNLSRKSLPTLLGKNIVCENITEEHEKTFGEFSKLGTGVHLMWPGNLVQGQTIRSGQIATIPIGDKGRNPIEVKVDAFSSNHTTSTSKHIDNPTAGKVQNELGTILDSYYTSGTIFPANYSIDIQRTSSNKHLQLALNVGYTGPAVDLSASLGINIKSNRTYYAVTLKQKFFSVSVTPKVGLKGANGWIQENYPQDQITPYISPDNPPVYISSVTYGRLYLLVYESNESSTKVEQALNFAFKNPTTPISVVQKSEFQSTLQNATVYVKQFGGSASGGLESSLGALSGNFDSIRNFVVSGAEASKSNPGYPIEYTAVNIGSNLPVTVKLTEALEYQNCIDRSYQLILKNTDFPTLPIKFRTQTNWNSSTFYLSPGESVTLPYDTNLRNFVYGNSVLKQIDLNNGNASDDINFISGLSPMYPSRISYKSGRFSSEKSLFNNYEDISITTAYTLEDNINGGGKALLIGTKDLANNALILEIKKK